MRTRALMVALAVTALVGCGDDEGGDDAAAGSGGSAGSNASGRGGSGAAGRGSAGDSAGRSGSGASGTSGSGTSGQGGSGNEDDGGVAGDGGMDEEFTGPILQRPTRGDFTCSVSKALVNLKPRMWGSTGHAMAGADDTSAWVARVEWMGTDPFAQGDSELLVSKVDASGAISGDVTVPVGDPSVAGHPVLVALDAGAHALIWVEGADSKVLRFATIDADGDVAIAPKTIVDSDLGDFPQPRAARAESGEIGLVWNGTGMNAFFVSVGEDGEDAGEPVQFGMNTAIAPPVIAPAAGGGFALLWKSKAGPDFEEPANVFFARVDAAGAFQKGPVQLTDEDEASAATFASGDLQILPADYGYLLAWTQGSMGETDFNTGENSGGYSIVRLQRIDVDGGALAPAADVRPMEEDIDEVEPTLIDFGEAVALLWGRGEHIYICGGCVPNHSVELVLLDPIALRPLSNVVKVSPTAGGLLRRSTAVAGSNLLTALDITFHVHSEPGFAAFSCE